MERALLERIPGLAGLPLVPLCSLPTPLAEIALPTDLAEPPAALLVKQDNLTHAVYGGNKVRKLEFLLGEALARRCRSVVTFGAYGSNHALATAFHARAAGLAPHVIMSPQAPGPFAAATLRAHAALGTVLYPIDGWDGAREAVRATRAIEETDGVAPLVIPMGGTSPLGALGYVNAAFEILEQGAAPDVVYVAGGTLGTGVGLAAGFALAGAPTRVEMLRVTTEEVGGDATAAKVLAGLLELLAELADGAGALPPADSVRFALRHDWFAPGYGVPTPETLAAVGDAARAQVKLETTYTGKAFAALLADARNGRLAGERVLFVNTYNSAAPLPQGDADLLPPVLAEYVAQCDRLYPQS